MPQASSSPVTVPGSGGPGWGTERLRSLTTAVIAVSAGLELTDVLQRLVTTAATVSGAAYGALGITGADGRISQFVTHGISPELRERLGGMPTAHGIPGLLLASDAQALRIPAIQAHPRSVGFPHDHPPMRTFLGVPVRVHGTIFGNLYVAEKQSPGNAPALFTADDEEALLALGAAAGVAVENARLYTAIRRKQRWSDALGRAIHAIIARSDHDARARLTLVPAIAREAGESDLAALILRASDGGWQVAATDVAPPDGTGTTEAGAVVGLTVPDAVTERVTPDAVVPLGRGDLEWLPGPWVRASLIPVGGTGPGCEEALVLAYRRDLDPALGPADLSSELVFGQRLGLALQVAQAQADSAALSLLRDRDRIARDLHDHVIQRLFSIGLSLQAAGVAARVPEVQSRLRRAVDDIDETIKDVRRTIFELHASSPRDTLRERVEAVLADIGDGLPPEVTLQVDGGIDNVAPDLAADLLAALREILTNVARHAQATTVQIYVTCGKNLEIEVVDDGHGLPACPHPGNGLGNLARRAADRGGSFELTAGDAGGTIALWAVPLP